MRVMMVRNWLLALGMMLAPLAAVGPARAQSDHAPRGGVRLWDTATPLHTAADLASRQAWREVVPAAAGRLQGDLVMEAEGAQAAFASRLGQVLVSGPALAAQVRAGISPVELAGKQAAIASVAVAEQDGVVIAVADFQAVGGDRLPIACWFTEAGALAIRAEGRTRGVTVAAPIDLAVVPSLLGDDLIYDPRDYPSARTLALPSEHLLLGLLQGENGLLVMTWQDAVPSVRLALSTAAGRRGIEAVTFTGGRDLCLAVLGAPGIWHRERLERSFLERDVALDWKPPFPATWLTQLTEDEVKTTFQFRSERGEHWRGGIGSYTFPTWLSGEKAMLSLSKQIPPEGEAVIYFLERNDDTPRQVTAPLDIAAATLAGDARVGVLSVEGRPSWWPMRPDAVIGGETCDVTDILKQIFAAGQEVQKQAIVRAGVEDMEFHLEVMFERNGRYYPFATDMRAYLDAQARAKPELAPYLGELRPIVEQMIATYDGALDTMRDMSYARGLSEQTVALAAVARPDNARRFLELKEGWCGMGGALEELSRREHTFARKLYQQAAYGAAQRPDAIPVAEEIRRRVKHCLQRPDSYEIWANH